MAFTVGCVARRLRIDSDTRPPRALPAVALHRHGAAHIPPQRILNVFMKTHAESRITANEAVFGRSAPAQCDRELPTIGRSLLSRFSIS
jgi:hypothetical protein